MPRDFRTRIRVDNTKANTAIRSFERSVESLTKEMKQLRRGTKKTGRATKKTGTEFVNMRHKTHGLQRSFGTLRNQILIAKYALATIGAYAAGKFVKQSVSAAASMEKWALSFEVMTGSAEAGKKAIEELEAFEKETTLQLPDIIQNAKQLKAMGIELDNVIPVMKSLGDVAFGLDVPLSRLALNFGQVKAQGELGGRELKDFERVGVSLSTELAKNLGKTKEEIDDMVSAGEIGFEEVKKAFETMTSEGGMFYDIMKRGTKTYAGQVSLLQTEIFKLKVALGKDLLPVIKETIKQLKPLLKRIKGDIDAEKTAIEIRKMADSLLKLAEAGWENRHWIDEIAVGLATLWGVAKLPALIAGFKALGVGIVGFGSNAAGSITTIGNLIAKFKALATGIGMWSIAVDADMSQQEAYQMVLADTAEDINTLKQSYEDYMSSYMANPIFETQKEDADDAKKSIKGVSDEIRTLQANLTFDTDEPTILDILDELHKAAKKTEKELIDTDAIEIKPEIDTSWQDDWKDTLDESETDLQAFGNVASNILVQAFDGGFDNISEMFGNLLKQMAADLIVSGILSILTGGTSKGFGFFAGLFGGHTGGTFTNYGGNIVKAAGGLDGFTVPNGFPNDSFPIMVESGETVSVTPTGQMSRTEQLLEALIETINRKPVANTVMFDDIGMSRYVEGGNNKRVNL